MPINPPRPGARVCARVMKARPALRIAVEVAVHPDHATDQYSSDSHDLRAVNSKTKRSVFRCFWACLSARLTAVRPDRQILRRPAGL